MQQQVVQPVKISGIVVLDNNLTSACSAFCDFNLCSQSTPQLLLGRFHIGVLFTMRRSVS